MKSVILCEGKTDAILLSYYLNKAHGWEYNSKIKEKIPVRNEGNSSHCWYSKNEDQLLIIGVGGNRCFNEVIEHILNVNIMDGERAFKKIVIITDRDTNEKDSNILEDLNKNFSNKDNEFCLKNNKWEILNINDEFNERIQIEVAAIIIPFSKNGALETFLLDALSEDEDKKFIIEKVREFIYNLQSKKYLNTERLKLKAELGITFATISPEKVFVELNNMLIDIPWENYNTIQTGFSILNELNGK